MGGEGQPCFENKTCAPGLTCAPENVCLRAAADAGADSALDSGSDVSFDGAQDGSDSSDVSDPSDVSDAATDAGVDAAGDVGDAADAGGDVGGDTGVPDAGAGPVITGVDGTGPQMGVSPRPEDQAVWNAHAGNRVPAEHRIETATRDLVVTGDRLAGVTLAVLKGQTGQGEHQMTIKEASMTYMKLGWPSALTTGGMFVLALLGATGDTSAQVYFLQGQDGAKGDKGDTGNPGVSVSAASEAPGPNCTYGGVKYTSGAGDTYVCNGAPGQQGQQGVKGDQGVQGLKGDKGDPGTFSGTFVGDVTFTGNLSLSGNLSLQGAISAPCVYFDGGYACNCNMTFSAWTLKITGASAPLSPTNKCVVGMKMPRAWLRPWNSPPT
jgi:hypothetical protein